MDTVGCITLLASVVPHSLGWRSIAVPSIITTLITTIATGSIIIWIAPIGIVPIVSVAPIILVAPITPIILVDLLI